MPVRTPMSVCQLTALSGEDGSVFVDNVLHVPQSLAEFYGCTEYSSTRVLVQWYSLTPALRCTQDWSNFHW